MYKKRDLAETTGSNRRMGEPPTSPPPFMDESFEGEGHQHIPPPSISRPFLPLFLKGLKDYIIRKIRRGKERKNRFPPRAQLIPSLF
jgi:hypothetical protein